MLTFIDEFITEGFSKTPRTNLNGMFKKCAYCGKEFTVPDENDYPFKGYDEKNHCVWFEKESCKRKFLEKVDCKIKRRKHIGEEAMERYRQKRLAKIEQFGKPFYQAWVEGMTQKEIAAKFNQSPYFVFKWLKAYREVMA